MCKSPYVKGTFSIQSEEVTNSKVCHFRLMIIVPEAMTTLEGERREDNSFFEVSNRD